MEREGEGGREREGERGREREGGRERCDMKEEGSTKVDNEDRSE